jgi:hypothetical protein
MTVTVATLLALPGWTRTVRVLAGAAGLGREVTGARAVLEPGGDQHPAAGELVVLVSPVAARLRRRCSATGWVCRCWWALPIRSTC